MTDKIILPAIKKDSLVSVWLSQESTEIIFYLFADKKQAKAELAEIQQEATHS